MNYIFNGLDFFYKKAYYIHKITLKENYMNRHAGSERNLTLVMDLYELTMAYNYFKQGNKDQLVYFDMFYRKKW